MRVKSQEQSVSARRRNQHPGRTRYPEPMAAHKLMGLLSFAMKAISYKLCPAASSLSIKGSFSTEGNILTGLINALASANHLNKAVHRFFCIATLVLASA